MTEIRIKIDSKDLMDLLSCAKLYNDEAKLTFADNSLTITDVDVTHVQMYDLSTVCEASEPCVIAVPLEKMIKALSATGDNIDIVIEDGILTIRGDFAKVKVPLIGGEQTFKWPQKFTQPIASCDIAPSLLAPLVSYGKFTNASVAKFSIHDTRMTILIGELPDLSEVQSPNTATGESTSMFSLEYIDTLLKHVKSVPTLTVSGFGDKFPMIFQWETERSKFKVCIAPWTEEE